MDEKKLSIREMLLKDIPYLADYWTQSPHEYLISMGVDITKLPSRESFITMLEDQFHKPIEQKRSYCLIWLYEDQPVGHSNTNPTYYGREANMHLHIWENDYRKKGFGGIFLQMTIPLFFTNLKLKKLICEPYALNPAPHRALQKLGFELEKEYTTIPGSINFEQPVKRWILLRKYCIFSKYF
jgi:RimJ/RimL family protein N-acetyltransferase